MARLINGVLDVPYFTPTGIPGEYEIIGATFTNYTDASGSGAYNLAVGFIVYCAAVDLNTAMPIPGVFHRYKLTSLTVVDYSTIDAVMLWDETGSSEEDAPLNASTCIVSEPTPGHQYGFPALDTIYSTLPTGMTIGAVLIDTKVVSDNLQVGSGGGSSSSFTLQVPLADYIWTVTHNKGSVNYVYTIFNEFGVSIMPDEVKTISSNTVQVSFSIPVAGRVVLAFY